jgi:2-dehydropantoate 2-reductase
MGSPLRIGVVGVGATGGYLATLLAAAEYPVTVVARGASREAILREGLAVDGPGDRSVRAKPASVIEPGKAGEPVDVVLFCVKSYDTEAALVGIEGLLGDDGRLLCLQNGVGNEEALARRFGWERVIPGVMYIGAERTAPGRIRVSTPARVILGSSNAGNRELVGRADEAFRAAGVDCTVNDGVLTDKWQKFLFNCGLNPLTAIAGMKLGPILEQDEGRALFDALVDEAIAAAKSAGAPLAGNAREKVFETARRMNISSSMAEDLAAGRPIEREAFTGHVCRLGAAGGVPTPVTAVFDRLLALRSSAARGR